MNLDDRCVKQVHNDGRSVLFHRCLRKGKVRRNGELYCTQHDPVEVAKRDKARSEQFDRDWEQKQAQWKKIDERRSAYSAMVKVLRDTPDYTISGFLEDYRIWLKKALKVLGHAEKYV